MKKGMRESYTEDLASHGGPESCVGVPRGRSEALTGVHAGRPLSLEMMLVWGADAVRSDGRQHRRSRFRERSAGPAGSENPCMRAISSCREPGGLVVARCLSMMTRPGWFAGWHVGWWRAAGGTPRR